MVALAKRFKLGIAGMTATSVCCAAIWLNLTIRVVLDTSTLECRRVYTRCVPYTSLAVWSYEEPVYEPLISYLRSKGYWRPDTQAAPHDVTIHVRSWIDPFLSGRLDAVFANDPATWVEWTESHPKTAPAAWEELLASFRDPPPYGLSQAIGGFLDRVSESPRSEGG